MKQATLCLLVKEDQKGRELCLGWKKFGFGKGNWNAAGGMFDLGKDKSIIDTVVRETEEEFGVKIRDFEKVAVFNFLYPKEKEWDQEVHIFLCKSWEGEPKESDEMAPQWFKEKEIPFSEMWVDDKFWLPRILGGEKLKGKFIFETRKVFSKKIIKTVKSRD